ncbi:MAG TPA: ComF family protein [Saprospiraceae bacterium]|nr:ComF family protein [Saprospiraceae bacterium]HNT20318.1 ComF family protein [Saprospiraceae bacterium]
MFFPRICLACDKNLQARGHLFCIHCSYTIAITDQWKKPENEFTEKFAGRLKLEQGAALYRFVPGGQLQQVIHKLKYQNRPDIGIHLGRTAGHQIHRYWPLPDLIVPVPLHPKKYWQRGYNQAEQIARGIGEITGIPVLPNALEKTGYTRSQTRLHRLERMQNMEKSFVQHPSVKMIGKHVLLVDDVLTTGATLEACALEILRNPGSRVSMCTLAMGRRI